MRGAFLAAFVIVSGLAARADDVVPSRDAGLPNPYTVENDWIKLPPGRTLGAVSAIDIDRDGKSVWLADRCGNIDDGCARDRSIDPVMHVDEHGNIIKSFGHGILLDPHGIFVDKDDNIWVVEGVTKTHIVGDSVRVFTPDGKLIRTLGTPGQTGDGPYVFNGTTDVLQAPDGSIFVSDGHDPGTNGRVIKYDKDGKFLLQFGKRGSGPTDFDPPHGLAMDKEGRLYVADRGNKAVKIFDQQGNLLQIWTQFGTPNGVFVDKNDVLYVADSTSNGKNNPGFHPGIRMAKVADGKVFAYIPWPQTGTLEGVAVADDGTVYGGFTNIPGAHRFLKN